MTKSRIPTWLGLILVPVGFLLVGFLGIWAYMSTAGARLHPDPRQVISVAASAASQKLSRAVEQAQQIVRAHLAEHNLPGLSVAVGIGGDIAWAEGFGLADLKNSVAVTPNHRFRIGTASTVLTSAAAGLLLESGSLKLTRRFRRTSLHFQRSSGP